MFGIMNNKHNIDVSGYNCPIPVLKIKKVIKKIELKKYIIPNL